MPHMFRALILIALFASVAAPQDTPTEREAASDVLKKMSALEQSLDVPGLVDEADRAPTTPATASSRARRS